jgi:hypothetical protein
VLLFLHGEQGAAKSTAARVFRRLVDPNTAPLRCEPRDNRDLAITAKNSWLIMMDNLSGLPVRLSEALCRLSTGGGLATRELYTDSDEVIFDAMRPAALTGIEDLATRGDLLDRGVVLTLPTITDGRRRPEEEFWADFDREAPAILGALLDALVVAVRNLPTVKLASLPRMADFGKFVTAAEPGLGFPPGTIMAAYLDNRGTANVQALESSPVGPAVLRFCETIDIRNGGWEGTAADLLDALESREGPECRKRKEWPGTPRAMGGAMRRLAPALRRVGIDVALGERESGGQRRRLITLERTCGAPSHSSRPSPDPVQTGGEPGRSRDGAGPVTPPDRPSETPSQDGGRDDRDGRDDDSPLFSVMCSWGTPANGGLVDAVRPSVAPVAPDPP